MACHNVWLYDVSDPDKPARVGAVSATTSVTQAGFALRLAIKDKFLYASTVFQGLQMIDLQQAFSDYQRAQSNPLQLTSISDSSARSRSRSFVHISSGGE